MYPKHSSFVIALGVLPMTTSAQTTVTEREAERYIERTDMNAQIIAYVEAHIGKRVGTGECWDLAAGALNEAGAKWDGEYRFGTPVDPEKEEILPGDIIQFEGVEVRYTAANAEHRETMGHHTAIIYTVHGKGRYTLAHQNFGPAGRKVNRTDLDLDHIVKGRYTIFRPGR